MVSSSFQLPVSKRETGFFSVYPFLTAQVWYSLFKLVSSHPKLVCVCYGTCCLLVLQEVEVLACLPSPSVILYNGKFRLCQILQLPTKTFGSNPLLRRSFFLVITAALLIHPSSNVIFCRHLNWTLSPSILSAQANFKGDCNIETLAKCPTDHPLGCFNFSYSSKIVLRFKPSRFCD